MWLSVCLSSNHQACNAHHVTGCVTVGRCYYLGQGTDRDLAKAIAWLEKAAAQNPNDSTASFVLGICYQGTDPARSERYFERARAAVWSSELQPEGTGLAALTVSEHFAKWHYLNYHQHITDYFRDAGRSTAVR